MVKTPEKDVHDEYRGRIGKSLRYHVDADNGSKPPIEIVREALMKEHPGIPIEESRNVAREIITAPKGTLINVGEEKPITVEDLQFEIAHSIEFINSETSSMQEYYRWIEQGDTALKELNDGDVTEKDVELRRSFLAPLDQREAEIILCINLYSKSEHVSAPEKVKELTNKLAKLREYRGKVEATKDKADEKQKKKEHEKSMAEELLRHRVAMELSNARERLEILSGRRTAARAMSEEKREEYRKQAIDMNVIRMFNDGNARRA